jgi:hypothetical protein
MKEKRLLVIGFFGLCLTLFAQELQHEVRVVNIEVPVRVFKGDRFVEDLKLEDFEVFENGRLQTIESVYLVKKTAVHREEGKRSVEPRVQRTFVFLFQMTDYLPEVEKAMVYFFEHVITAEDSLIIVTPLKTYNLKKETLHSLSRQKITDQLVGILRKDIVLGGTEYRNLIRELEVVMQDYDPNEAEGGLQLYSTLLEKLENLRAIDQKKLIEFAKFLKGQEGQKYGFLFYQKEVVPKIHPRIMNEMTSLSQDRMDQVLNLISIFDHYYRDVSFDVDLIKKTFSDSLLAIHFLFITKTPPVKVDITSLRPSDIMTMVEQSEDIYNAFREIALATGGFIESSADAGSAFKQAAEASENYYLLYYQPQDYKPDGKFRDIKVKVKKGDYTVAHRAGYFAN